jgi:rare lipoprotein A
MLRKDLATRLVVAFMTLTLFACAERNVPGSEALPALAASGSRTTVDEPTTVTRAGATEAGKASIYSDSLQGKPMANGKPYRRNSDIAASKTLPLGTVAKVTNLENGRSVLVKVVDRAPFHEGCIVDLAPHAASKLGLTKKQGIAPVVVEPVKASPSTGE